VFLSLWRGARVRPGGVTSFPHPTPVPYAPDERSVGAICRTVTRTQRRIVRHAVPLLARSRLGPYEIVASIGAGGMGEVYRAHDPRLERDVAIKVLPAAFAHDSERLRRFEQEARAAAALNHPNIVTIHSVEQADGIRFLTMELVEGQPLSTLIQRGGVPLDQLLDVAIPLADALAAAHGKGITHRDLKPANVMVRADGRVKVLDFGLAKLQEPSPSAGGVTTMPTEDGTSEGRIVGTVAYMSPEQAEGKAIDHRSDLFSLGVILYEMASGRRPFTGDTSVSIISAILKDTPPSITDLRATLPRELGRIVRRALTKDPERRYQTAKDLRNELDELKQSIESGELAARAPTASAPVARRFPSWLVAAATIAAMGGLAGAFWLARRSSIATPVATAPVDATFTQLTALKGIEMFPTLSRDGTWFVYNSATSGNADIYLQSVGGQTPINLTKDSTADDWSPAFSPDGQRIAFRSERAGGGIFVMARTGEGVKRLTDTGFNPAWAPSGEEIVFAEEGVDFNIQLRERVSGLWIVNVATGEKRRITAGDAVQPQWSPHGYRIAYWAARGSRRQRDIATIPAAGGVPVFVTDDEAVDWNPVWSPDGRYLYFSSDRGGSMNLWRVPIDEQSGQALGSPAPITTPSRFVAHMSFSGDGSRLAYASFDLERNIQAVAFDPVNETTVGRPIEVTSGSRLWNFMDVSPDGQWLALASEQGDLFVARSDGTSQRQLTNDRGVHRIPQWSRDGQRIAFTSNRAGVWDIWTISPDGGGLTQLTKRAGAHYPIWSPDGTRIAYTEFIDTTRVGLFDPRRPWESQTAEMLPAKMEWSADAWAPDGSQLAGTLYPERGIRSSAVRDTAGIVVYSIDGRSYTKITDVGSQARWLSDSRRLLFVSEGKVLLVDRRSRKVHDLISEPGRDFTLAIPSRDDRRIYLLRVSAEADVWLTTLKH